MIFPLHGSTNMLDETLFEAQKWTEKLQDVQHAVCEQCVNRNGCRLWAYRVQHWQYRGRQLVPYESMPCYDVSIYTTEYLKLPYINTHK